MARAKWRLVRGQSCVHVRSAASVTVSIFGAARGTTRGAVTAPVYDSTVLEDTANMILGPIDNFGPDQDFRAEGAEKMKRG